MFLEQVRARAQPGEEEASLLNSLERLTWKTLPSEGHCDGKARTFWSKGQTEFVEAIGSSPNGQEFGLRGGWQIGPLAGRGLDCLFRRKGEQLQLVGCRRTWVS
jgi:hypothetical protein